MAQRFYSNGKLLLTGEYAVLDGALALALPVKFGQDLTVAPTESGKIHWKSYDKDGTVWFETEFPLAELHKEIPAIKDSIQKKLFEILRQADCQNPEILNRAKGFSIETRLTFPRKWGLGTSSTLLNNIAQWFGIDAFELLRESFGGSGYDIACAQHESAVLYQIQNGKPTIQTLSFDPAFQHQLYFVYLNQKQDSKAAIAAYRENTKALSPFVAQINAITHSVLSAKKLGEFEIALQNHENLMSEVLQRPTVKQLLFPDFPGTLKSLGAWGGDFILAATTDDPTAYFHQKGYDTVVPYREMIL